MTDKKSLFELVGKQQYLISAFGKLEGQMLGTRNKDSLGHFTLVKSLEEYALIEASFRADRKTIEFLMPYEGNVAFYLKEDYDGLNKS